MGEFSKNKYKNGEVMMTDTNNDFPNARVALLIDTDNISRQHVDEIFQLAAEKGNVIVRRGYGNMDFNWNKEEMLRYAIQPVTRFVNVAGKNVTDMALVIDALDLVHRKIVDVICIVSNDSDFSLLASKLRELGINVRGIGTSRAQKSFVASCDDFEHLAPLQDKHSDSETSSAPKLDGDNVENHHTVENSQNKSDLMQSGNKSGNGILHLEKDIINMLKDACERFGDDSGWTLVAQVASYIKQVRPGFSAGIYGHKKFISLVKATEAFEYDFSKSVAPKMKIKEDD